MVCNIHGPKITIETSTATILGTKASVCSWICVVAWKILMTNPTTIPKINIGADTISTVQIASRATAIMNVSVKTYLPAFLEKPFNSERLFKA